MIDMKIENYHITSDKYGLTVTKLPVDDEGKQRFSINKKTGELVPVENTMGSYSTVSQALAGIRKNMLYTGTDAIATMDDYRRESSHIEMMFDDYLADQAPKSKYGFS